MSDSDMSPALQLAACIVLLIGLIVGSSRQPACFPWPDEVHQEPLTCRYKNGTAHDSGRWQTISEMTARSGTTAELLSGLAAAMLIAIWNALAKIKEHRADLNWDMILATYVLGAVGFVGLTVWNLRVQSTVHTCFTSQTIIAVYIQVWELTESRGPGSYGSYVWMPRVVLGAFALLYVVGFVVVAKPDPIGMSYFDFDHYWFAIGQYLFFVGYFAILALIARSGASGNESGTGKGVSDGTKKRPHLPYRPLQFEL